MLNHMADENGNQAATKADVAGLKTDVESLKAGVGSLRVDVESLKADVGSLRADVESLRAATKADIDSLRTETIGRIESAKMETFERIERSETTLLKEFRKWSGRNNAKLKVHDARDSSYDQRLSMLRRTRCRTRRASVNRLTPAPP
jgi:chromosome segregation ATPase